TGMGVQEHRLLVRAQREQARGLDPEDVDEGPDPQEVPAVGDASVAEVGALLERERAEAGMGDPGGTGDPPAVGGPARAQLLVEPEIGARLRGSLVLVVSELR